MQRARSVGDAGRVVAAIVGARTGVAGFAALVAEGVAPRHAESIELAAILAGDAPAAIVPRRRDRAGVVLVVADVALRVAAGGVTADADGEPCLDLADDVSVARHSAAGGAAAVRVLRAEVPVDVTALGGLADLHAGGAVGSAQTTAAIAAAGAHGAVETSVAERGARGRRAAGAERGARGDRAHASAAIGALGAGVAVLDAEGRGDRAAPRRVAELRAALRALRARVAGRLAGFAQGLARAATARAAAASTTSMITRCRPLASHAWCAACRASPETGTGSATAVLTVISSRSSKPPEPCAQTSALLHSPPECHHPGPGFTQANVGDRPVSRRRGAP